MAVLADVEPPASPAPVAAAASRLAPGTELLGEYQDSGYQTPKYLVRRADGQVMQLPQLLYRLAASLDGRDAGRIATALNSELGQELTGDDVSFLVEDRLRPVGLMAGDAADGAGPSNPVFADPLLALRYRVGVLPASVSWRVGGIFRPFFHRPVWVIALGLFLAVDVAVLAQGDLIERLVAGVTTLIERPELVLAIFGIVFLSGVFHEFGHVTACRYGGARPGEMGIGLYLVWPAMYSTVTDTYRLGRTARLRTDLAGVYFNAISMAAVGGLYLTTGEPWLLIALFAMHTETAWQFIPTIRFDGYYMLADLVGVPELFSYVGPALRSLVPGRPTHPKVRELRPWSRRLIVAWVGLTVPVLLFYLVVIVLVVPRVLPLLWEAVLVYLETLKEAVSAGGVATVALSVFQLITLLLPWLGSALMTVLVSRIFRRAAFDRWGWRWLAPDRWVGLRRTVGPPTAWAAVLAAAAVLIWRVVSVADTAPPGSAEGRIVTGAEEALQVGADSASAATLAEVLARDQLAAYVRLTPASGRPDGLIGGARELAVLACVVLVGCFLAVGVIRGWRSSALALPLIGVALTGPAVQALAAFGPVLLGAAWTAVGVSLLLWARARHGRHRRPRLLSVRGVVATLGCLAVVVGAGTAPALLVPLAVAGVVWVLGSRFPSAPPVPWNGVALGVFVVVALAGAVVPSVLSTPARAVVAGAEHQVLAALATVLVVGGLVQRSLRPFAVVAGSAGVLALVPLPGAGSVLPMLVCAAAVLAALVVQAWIDVPVGLRPHPLLRAMLVLPVVVLVCVGALYGTADLGDPAGPSHTASATGSS